MTARAAIAARKEREGCHDGEQILYKAPSELLISNASQHDNVVYSSFPEITQSHQCILKCIQDHVEAIAPAWCL